MSAGNTMYSLTGTVMGNLEVGDISASSPARRYNVKCNKCLSSWTETHVYLRHFLDSRSQAPCRNDMCVRNLFGKAESAKETYLRERKAELEQEALAEDRRLRALYGKGGEREFA